MRSIQRGIATSIILILFLILGIAAVSGYFIFSQNQQKLAAINSFDDCAKAGYPIMESYPEQCNTPDGKHFVRELSEEEKKKLVPPTPEPTVLDETTNWKTYTNRELGIEFKHPQESKVLEGGSNGVDRVLIEDQNTISLLLDTGLQMTISAKPTKQIEVDYFKAEYMAYDGKEGFDYDGKEIQTIYIDGMKTLKGSVAGPKSNRVYTLIYNDKVYYISFEPEVTKTGESILNSIKFLE